MTMRSKVVSLVLLTSALVLAGCRRPQPEDEEDPNNPAARGHGGGGFRSTRGIFVGGLGGFGRSSTGTVGSTSRGGFGGSAAAHGGGS